MSRAVLLAAFVVLAAPAPAQAQDFTSLGRDVSALCLEDAGAARLSMVEARPGRITTTIRSGLQPPEASLRWPPGIHLGCPQVAVAPDGSAVAAAVVTAGRAPLKLLVATREPGGAFGAPVEVAAPGRAWSLLPAVAAARGGAAIVAWGEAADDGNRQRYRVRAIRRAPGGSFGAAETLVPLHHVRDSFGGGLSAVATGMDAAGSTTVAWVRGLRRLGRVGSRSAVEVAAAAPGAAFGEAQLLERGQDALALSLAVAPDGRALLAHDGAAGISAYDRAPGGAFARLATYPETEEAAEPAVALAADGGAVVAWREPDGRILAVTRVGAGPFGSVRVVGERRADGFEGGWGAIALRVVLTGAWVVPHPRQTDRLHALAAPGGAAAVGWLDADTAAGLPARGVIADLAAGRSLVAGGPVRDVTAFAPLLGPAGGAWIDNMEGQGVAGDGRLHIAAAPLPPPHVEVNAPARRLWHGDRLPVTVRCAAACDVRAAIAARRSRGSRRDFLDGGPPWPALATGGRADAGPVRLAVTPAFSNHIAPPRGGKVAVVVTATAPGGTEATRTTVRVRVDRRRIPPLRRPLEVRGVREGDDVMLTWRTAKPAWRQFYLAVTARHRRPRAEPSLQRTAGERPADRRRTRYRLRLRDVPARHRFVRLTAVAMDPPGRSLAVVARISGGRA